MCDSGECTVCGLTEDEVGCWDSDIVKLHFHVAVRGIWVERREGGREGRG